MCHKTVAYKHIKWWFISKLLIRAFSWHPLIPGTLKLESILSLFILFYLSRLKQVHMAGLASMTGARRMVHCWNWAGNIIQFPQLQRRIQSWWVFRLFLSTPQKLISFAKNPFVKELLSGKQNWEASHRLLPFNLFNCRPEESIWVDKNNNNKVKNWQKLRLID